MKRKPLYALPAMPFALWNQLALKTGEMMLASAQVIGHRTQRMAKAGALPSTRDQREFTLMREEKIEAANEAAWAMSCHMTSFNSQLGVRAWRDMLAASSAMLSLAASRTPIQAMVRHAALTHTVAQSASSASNLSDAAAHLVERGLKPIHSRATANAKRLGRR